MWFGQDQLGEGLWPPGSEIKLLDGIAGRKCILSISSTEWPLLLGCSVLSSQRQGPFRIRAPNKGDVLTLAALPTLCAREVAENFMFWVTAVCVVNLRCLGQITSLSGCCQQTERVFGSRRVQRMATPLLCVTEVEDLTWTKCSMTVVHRTVST